MSFTLHHITLLLRPLGLSLLMGILSLSHGIGQEVEFQVNAPQTVVVGQQFRVIFSINAEGSQFSGPDFKGLSMLSGPNASTSSNIQIINNQVISTFNYSYTYFLLADQEGNFQIGSARIIVAGTEYQTKPFQIRVSPGQAPQQRSPGAGQSPSTPPPAEGVSKEDVFFRAHVDNAAPYQGEQVLITYRIYTRVQINLPGGIQQPPLQGFWVEDLLRNQTSFQQSRQKIDGQEYVVVEYKKLAIFPQRSGKITIEPFEVQVNARVQSRRRTGDPFFDQFFGGSMFGTMANVPVNLRSNTIHLDVKPLPSAGRPADFGGAVGQYKLNAEANPLKLRANEAITLKYTLRGSGNLRMLEHITPTFPPDFETYDPKLTDNISLGGGGVSGSRTFEFLAIPRSAGRFTVKPVTFSYFDPASAKYITLTSDIFDFEVERGSLDGGVTTTYSGVTQEDIRFIGSDIRFIRTGAKHLQHASKIRFGTTNYWLSLGVPLLLFLLFLTLWRRRIRLLADTKRQRNRRASKLARARLRKSRKLVNHADHHKFYETLAAAIWGYLSDKLGIPRANLSMEYTDELLGERGIEASLRGQLKDLLDDYEFRRYAPRAADGGRQEAIEQAQSIITNLENALRR